MIIEDLEHIGNESEFSEGDPVWFARYYYPKRTIGIISQSYGKNIISEGEIFLFDQFGSTSIWNFVAKKSEYSRDQFVYEVFKAVCSRVKELIEKDGKKRTKYPINYLAQFDDPPMLPKYIDDYSTDKEEKDRIKEEYPEFILEE